MKKVLLLTDYSKNSINAIHYALQLFEHEICTFYVLHVHDPISYTTDDLMSAGNVSIYDSIIKEEKQKLNTIVNQLKTQFNNKNHHFETSIDYDKMIDAINQTIELKHIDLIVMGSNGVTGAKEVIFGSNTINVIRKVDCPTLVIPDNFKYTYPKDILLPLDEFDTTSGKAFLQILNFIDPQDSVLHILRMATTNKNSEEAKKDEEHLNYFLKNTSYKYHLINDVPLHFSVNNYMQTHHIDMMVLLVQTETLFERLFLGSSTTEISKSLKTPLLVFHT